MSTALTTKGANSRAAILAAGRDVISAKGFVAVTLQDILDAAQVTKGKFFHHFESKDHYFGELLRSVLNERGVVQFAQILEGCRSRDALSQLLYLIKWLIEWHKRGLPESMRLCIFATFFFPPDSPEMNEISKRLSANAKVLKNLVIRCQKLGALPRELDPEVFALVFPCAAVGGNIVGFLHGHKRLTQEALEELKKIVETLSRGHRQKALPA